MARLAANAERVTIYTEFINTTSTGQRYLLSMGVRNAHSRRNVARLCSVEESSHGQIEAIDVSNKYFLRGVSMLLYMPPPY